MHVDQYFSPFSNIYLNVASQFVFWTFLFKFLIEKTKRDARLCEFAATLPGPFAFPVIGNGLDFLLAGKDGSQELLMDYTKKYGSLYKLWIGKVLVVAVSNVEYLETIFRTPTALGKPAIFRPFHDFWGNGVFTAPMHVWRMTRKRIQPFFAKNAVKLEVPLINETVHKYVEILRKHVDGPTFDIYDYLPYLAVDSFVKVHLGLEFYEKERKYYDFHRILQFGGMNGVLRMFVPLLQYDFIAKYYIKKQTPIQERLQHFNGLMAREKFSNLDRQKTFTRETTMETFSKSFLSSVYRLEREMALKNYAHDEINILLAAASDTSALTNAFFLLVVAMYPDIQDRLYAEILDVFGDDDRPATVADIQRLPYFDQVLKESQRYFTIVPFVVRDVEEDLKIGSSILPAGTTILIHIRGVHCNPDSYPDPMKFNPENFSPEAVSRRSKYSFIPFSAGTRNCIGQNYAETNVKLTLIALLRNFTFHTNEKLEDVKMTNGFNSGKVGGFPVTIKSRIGSRRMKII